jgi:hypothetical protein
METLLSSARITAFASLITALTLVIIWRQIRADHERSRREKAIELMNVFTGRINEISPGIWFASRLLDKLDLHQCESLWNLEKFQIDAKYENLLYGSIQWMGVDLSFEKVNNQILLSQEQVLVLRFITGSYMNVLETICAAWRHNIADRDIIEDEFGPLVMPKHDLFPIENIRVATGKYPSIAAFTKVMSHKGIGITSKSKVA